MAEYIPTKKEEVNILIQTSKRHFKLLNDRNNMQESKINEIVNECINRSQDKYIRARKLPDESFDIFEQKYTRISDNRYISLYFDNNKPISICIFVYKDINYKGLNIYDVTLARFDSNGKITKFKYFTEENEANLNKIENSPKGTITDKASIYGGASNIDEIGSLGLQYDYHPTGQDYELSSVELKDKDNYCLYYKKINKNKKVEDDCCGKIYFSEGNILYSWFADKKDFNSICNLHKCRDINQVSEKCGKHVFPFIKAIKEF